jgi:hypothetical protein
MPRSFKRKTPAIFIKDMAVHDCPSDPSYARVAQW